MYIDVVSATGAVNSAIPTNAALVGGVDPSSLLQALSLTLNKDLRTSDGMRATGATFGALTLTTAGTTYEAKVGGSFLSGRKLLVIESFDNLLYWGTSSSAAVGTGQPLVKGQTIAFKCDPTDPLRIWLVSSVSGATARITETA